MDLQNTLNNLLTIHLPSGRKKGKWARQPGGIFRPSQICSFFIPVTALPSLCSPYYTVLWRRSSPIPHTRLLLSLEKCLGLCCPVYQLLTAPAYYILANVKQVKLLRNGTHLYTVVTTWDSAGTERFHLHQKFHCSGLARRNPHSNRG